MTTMTAEQALSELLSGNLRFIGGQYADGRRNAARRVEVAAGQHPCAVVLGCSDSRVPPEVVFDQGLGDLFVVRQAGHTVGGLAMGSIIYAVEHLHVPLIVVLGHSKCGAIAAAAEGHNVTGSHRKVIEALKPSVDQARAHGGDLLDAAVRVHIQRTVALLKADAVLGPLEKGGMLKITGARYDLETGVVTLVP
ncbi:MAG: carbonic anhydrase [Planctomycetota bacterium]|nr:carbonic anhydrase [Planctomycetota bacterium]